MRVKLSTGVTFGLGISDSNVSRRGPPSARFVLKLLEYEGSLTQQEMVRESGLSVRTIRNALTYLLSHNFVTKEPNLRDARQDVYTLA